MSTPAPAPASAHVASKAQPVIPTAAPATPFRTALLRMALVLGVQR